MFVTFANLKTDQARELTRIILEPTAFPIFLFSYSI